MNNGPQIGQRYRYIYNGYNKADLILEISRKIINQRSINYEFTIKYIITSTFSDNYDYLGKKWTTAKGEIINSHYHCISYILLPGQNTLLC